MNKKLPVSIIIPAREAEITLGLTLSGLLSGTKRPGEILVIDGLSMDKTREVAQNFDCRVLSNPLMHTAAARQIGVIEAQYDLIAMTDADCVPDNRWLDRIYNHFLNDASLDGVGGVVILKNPLSRVQRYCAVKAQSDSLKREEIISQIGMRGRFPGSNCAYRRQAVLEVGGYDQRFKAHGEDIDLFWRLIRKEKRLMFDPKMVVNHLGFSRDLVSLGRKSFGYGLASAWLSSIHFGKSRIELGYLLKPWMAAFNEAFQINREKYPACVFVDKLFFSLGKDWGVIQKAK